jgi:hypothetical protein
MRALRTKCRLRLGCIGHGSFDQLSRHSKTLRNSLRKLWKCHDHPTREVSPSFNRFQYTECADVYATYRGLVRLYIQLPQRVKQGEYLDRSKITANSILQTAQAVFYPYTLESDNVEWFTGYHIGQRLTESFGQHRRVFLGESLPFLLKIW